MIKVIAENLEKKYQRRRIIKNLNFELAGSDALVIKGPNGSGKTTLIKLISGLLAPTMGLIRFMSNDEEMSEALRLQTIGLVSPYLQFYKELTARENLLFFAKARTGRADVKRIQHLMARLGLKHREHDLLKTYSSGMLQRVKYVAALYHRPGILLLDEPTANLDENGKQIVYDLIEEHKKKNILIVATNEPEETHLASKYIELAS